MKLYIYGAGENGKAVAEMIKKSYLEECSLDSFLDNSKQGIIDGVAIRKTSEVDVSEAIVIIAMYDFKEATKVFLELREKGCKRIWWFKTPKRVFGHDFFREQCIRCDNWQKNMIEHVEMHVMDSCNLNCRGCTHFSPIFKNEIPVFDSRIDDMKQLANKGVHIVQFYILGGEPFLNPEIDRYVIESRNVFPNSEIVIVTNGLLIPKLNEHILASIRDNDVKISISEYMPTHKIIDQICEILDNYSIIYSIRPFDTKEKFNKPLRLDKNVDYKSLCISNGCVNIWNGKISRCPTLMFIETFNKKFNTMLPSEGIMSLVDCPEGKQLIDELEKSVPLCSYCIENEIDWAICGKSVSVNDFAV